MATLINVAAVSFRPEIRNMLQRYVGGILNDVANVAATTPEAALATKYDLYIVYTRGMVFTQLSRTIGVEHLIPVELYPVPIGLKRVLSVPEGLRLGIIGGHLWDAADLLSQLIGAGVRNYVFSTGTPETIAAMTVDKIVVPEEIAPYVTDSAAAKKMVVVPRTLDSQSVATIIRTAMKVQQERGKCSGNR